MSFKFMKLHVDWNGEKYNSRLELGDASTSPDTPVDIRFKVPGYIENVHTIYFQDYSSGTNVPRIYGDATNLVFFDPQNTSGKTLTQLAASELPSGVQGDILYHSDTGWTRLGYGTNGYFLKTQGISANPVWAAGDGGESLWEDDVTYAWLTTSKHINLQDKSIIGIQSLKSFDTDGIRHHDSSDASAFTIAPIVSTVTYAWRAWADGRMEGNDIIMGTGKITGLAAGTVSGDAVALDGDGYVPILDLPLGGTGVRGDLLVGTNAGCSTIQAGANGLVLTADSAQTAGVKWAAVGAGSGLWQSTGTPARTSLIATQPIDLYDDIDMHGKDIDNLYRIDAHDASGVGLYDHNGSWRAVLANPSYAMQCLNAGIDMNDTQKITSLVAGSGAGDSVRYEQVLLLAGGTMSGEGADINMAQAMLTNAGGISLYDASDYIDMNGGDVRDISELSGQYTSQFAYDHVHFKGHYWGNTDANYTFMEWKGGTLEINMGTASTKINDIYEINGQTGTQISINSDHRLVLGAYGVDYLTIGPGTYSNTIHCHQNFVPNTTGTEQCGFSTRKWSTGYFVTVYEGDHAYSELSCAKCEESFKIGDAIVHVMLEKDEIDGSTVTIPIHATCAQQDKKLVEIDRYEREIIEFFVEDDGTIEKRWESKIQKKLYNKLVLKDGVKKDKDGFYVHDGKRLAKDEIFDVVESTREVPVMVKKKYLI